MRGAQIVVVNRGGAEVASWFLPAVRPIDMAVVDDLARLQIAARRLGCSIRLRDPCAELLELLDLVGLGGEVVGEAESGEECGV